MCNLVNGNSSRLWCINFIKNEPTGEFEVKDIDAILDDEPIIGEKQLQIWEWIANYYCCTLGEVLKAALPSGLKLESQTKISLNPDASYY